jgi:DNA invertase Pin-like site-specific DNA recombinase
MEKVVLLARVSTDKQEFNRQITELKTFCGKMNWDIVGTFANKVSGAETIENRT